LSEKLELTISQTQLEFYQDWDSEFQIASGSIRSGKTYTQHWKLREFLNNIAIKNVAIILSGKTGETVERNIIIDYLNLMQRLGESKWYKYTKQPRLLFFKPKNIRIEVIGGNDDSAEERVRGMTAQALFIDEATLSPKNFFQQCCGRLSAGKGYKIMTTNPDEPTHWLKTGYMDNPNLSVKCFFFKMKDNPILKDRYIKSLYAQYTGMAKKRFLEGQWVGDEDTLILPEFHDREKKIVYNHPRPEHFKSIVAMDVGFDDFTAILFGYYDFMAGKMVIEDELFIRKPNTEEIANGIKKKEKELWGDTPVDRRVSDIDKILIHDLRTIHGISVRATRKDDKDAQINSLRVAIGAEKIAILPKCSRLIYQMKTGSWNAKHTDFVRTEEQGHCDGIAALVYGYRNLNRYDNPFPAGYISPVTNHINEWSEQRSKKSQNVEAMKKAFGVIYANR